MSQDRPDTVRLIAASVWVMLLCAGLGGFGGCDLSLAQSALGGKPGNDRIIMGTLAGLAVGLIVSLWDKFLTKQPSPVWRRFLLRFAYGCAWFLIAVGMFRGEWTKSHVWASGAIPIRFDRKNSVSARFTADSSATYDVRIILKRNLPVEDLTAFTTYWTDSHTPPPGPMRPKIKWTVAHAEPGNSDDDWSAVSQNDTVALTIGHFKAVEGKNVTVTVQVLKPSPKVQILDPHVQVASGDIFASKYYAASMVAGIGGMIAGVIGFFLIMVSFIRLLIDRRQPQTS